MYFIKYHPLKEKLRDRTLSDREALPYLVLFAAVTALTGSSWFAEEFNVWDGISLALSVGTAIWGVLYAYRQNGGARGFDLIQKYVVLGWIVSVRLLVVFIPTAIVLIAAGEWLGLLSLDRTGPYDVAAVFITEVIFYQRIGRHVRDTAEKPANQASDATSEPAPGTGSSSHQG